MRVVGGVLWVVATLVGASAAFWFSLAGLGWSNGFSKRHYWEEGESGIGVAFGVVALLVWVLVLAWSIFLLRGESSPPSRGGRAASLLLAVASVGVVVVLSVLAIAWPEPPSEYPLPPWNRA